MQSAILCGETTTGVTIMKTELGMDTGDIVSVAEVKIAETDTADSLSEKLSNAGAKLLAETFVRKRITLNGRGKYISFFIFFSVGLRHNRNNFMSKTKWL